jgi:photosystem II stability/assembly factor-like uncharacterized protein
MFQLRSVLATLLVVCAFPALAAKAPAKPEEDKPKPKMDSGTFTGLAFRAIGPAMISGRISDIAVDPKDHGTWYVTAASGNVWKTTNYGTTWSPIFDSQGSYSIGCVALDPKNPLVVWIGTGENNSQRSVAYGDGVYKSVDGGKSFVNVGLKGSEHIGKILVDPRNSEVVWVAAQGPLWNDGGDRGLYKSVDGGTTWELSLKISDKTGVTDVVMDPRNPDVMIAAAYQRRRHVWTLINGGPESALYKTTDAGKTWKKIESGMPSGDVGRIGLAVSPVNPDTVYAIVEAAEKGSGFYRSLDGGWSWEKRSDYVASGPQYYNEIIADPKFEGRVYSMDTWMHVTEDGGKTFTKVGEKFKHVDNHALWIDPSDVDHMIAGCDGGVYWTRDRGATWNWIANLPLAQFYKVAVDDAKPFYNVYGGTQDNNTVGGPVRTRTAHGIVNSDWFITVGGDGFQAAIDPTNPDIVYSQWQHGNLVRYDRKTGETVDIQPQPGPGEAPLRWNWDSPLVISPHAPTRLYFAAQRLFRSDDRGNTWTPVSPDLTAQIDRNKLKVMGRVWGVDTVAKNNSTSFYGNLVALSESPKKEGRLAVGSDDGLIHVSDDGGKNWTKIASFPGVPDRSYVSRVLWSRHDADVLFATFDNHKMGDFKPYVLRSADLGKSWTSVSGNLPARGTVYAIVEDPVKRDLLFAGTEFGVFFTVDGGANWVQLKGGIPTQQARDLAIQEREGDLVVATFGRGFYVLDDLSPLREVGETALASTEARLYPVRNTWMFVPSTPFGGDDKASFGDAYFTAPNPPFGAVFTYYLRDGYKSLKEQRREADQSKAKKGEDVFYPSWDDLRKEDREEPPTVVLTVTDEDGQVVRRVEGPAKSGFQRVAWDLRYPAFEPTRLTPPDDDPFSPKPAGPLAAPGTYTVTLAKRVGGVTTPLSEPRTFRTTPLGEASLPDPDREALLAFQRKTGRLQRAVMGAIRSAGEAQVRIDHLKKALADTPGADPKLADEVRAIEGRLKDLRVELTGDDTVARRNEPTAPSIADRVQQVVFGHWYATTDATATHRRNYEIASGQFAPVLERLRALVLVDLKRIEDAAEKAGAPWTPGRVPEWKPE